MFSPFLGDFPCSDGVWIPSCCWDGDGMLPAWGRDVQQGQGTPSPLGHSQCQVHVLSMREADFWSYWVTHLHCVVSACHALSWKLCLHDLLLPALRLPCCSDGLHGLTLKLLLLSSPSSSAGGAEWAEYFLHNRHKQTSHDLIPVLGGLRGSFQPGLQLCVCLCIQQCVYQPLTHAVSLRKLWKTSGKSCPHSPRTAASVTLLFALCPASLWTTVAFCSPLRSVC